MLMSPGLFLQGRHSPPLLLPLMLACLHLCGALDCGGEGRKRACPSSQNRRVLAAPERPQVLVFPAWRALCGYDFMNRKGNLLGLQASAHRVHFTVDAQAGTERWAALGSAYCCSPPCVLSAGAHPRTQGWSPTDASW